MPGILYSLVEADYSPEWWDYPDDVYLNEEENDAVEFAKIGDRIGFEAGETKNFEQDKRNYARRPLKGTVRKADSYGKIEVEGDNGSFLDVVDSGYIPDDPDEHEAHRRAKFASNFLLQSVNKQKSESYQLIRTFDGTYIKFYGKKPAAYTFNVVLLNTADFTWEAEFWKNFDDLFRGTQLTDMGAKAVITFDQSRVKGYFVEGRQQKTANDSKQVVVQFTVLVSTDTYFGGISTRPSLDKDTSLRGRELRSIAEAGAPSIYYQSRSMLTRQVNEGSGTISTGTLGGLFGAIGAFQSSVGNAISSSFNALYGRNIRPPVTAYGNQDFWRMFGGDGANPGINPYSAGTLTDQARRNLAFGNGGYDLLSKVEATYGTGWGFLALTGRQPYVRALSSIVKPNESVPYFMDEGEYLWGPGSGRGGAAAAREKNAAWRLAAGDRRAARRIAYSGDDRNRNKIRADVEAWMRMHGVDMGTGLSSTGRGIMRGLFGGLSYGLSMVFATTANSQAITRGGLDNSAQVAIKDPDDPTRIKIVEVGFDNVLNTLHAAGIDTGGVKGDYKTTGYGNRIIKGMKRDNPEILRSDGSGGSGGVYWEKKDTTLDWYGSGSQLVTEDGDSVFVADPAARGRFVDENGNPNPSYPPDQPETMSIGNLSTFYAERRYVTPPNNMDPYFWPDGEAPEIYVPAAQRTDRYESVYDALQHRAAYTPYSARANRFEGIGADGRYGDRVWTEGYIPTRAVLPQYAGAGVDGQWPADRRYVEGFSTKAGKAQ
jgi:hypothetical protein